jgi:hypothetical protein
VKSLTKEKLKLDWATYKAAKYACMHWHYSRCVPKFKQVWIGAWENKKFIGIISYGRSSTPYLGNKFGLKTTECVELTRIALTNHINPVSKIISISLKLLKKQSPGLKLIVSLADPLQGHNGIVYQASNWIYIGKSSINTQYFFRNKWRNDSSLQRYLFKNPEEKNRLKKRKIPGKNKYLMPLTKEMREKILPFAKPYPKACEVSDDPDQGHSGGLTPTHTLQRKDPVRI